MNQLSSRYVTEVELRHHLESQGINTLEIAQLPPHAYYLWLCAEGTATALILADASELAKPKLFPDLEQCARYGTKKLGAIRFNLPFLGAR